MSQLINLKCQNCNEILEIDLDHMQAYCPYCGSKLLIDVEDLDKILVAKEETKRKQMEYDHEIEMRKMDQEDDKRNTRELWIMLIGLIIVAGLCELFGCDI